MSTLADVAARAGVSKSTASRALNDSGYVSAETHARVTRAAQELGFVAHPGAASLATGRTQTVAVILPRADRWYFAELLDGVQEELLTGGLDLMLYNGADGSEGRARMLDHAISRRRFDGVIAVGIEPEAHEIERLLKARRPIVTIGPHSEGASSIMLDDRLTAHVATEHLIDLGHTDIAFLGGPADPQRAGFGDALRIRGYLDAMAEAGLEDAARIVPAESSVPGGYAAAGDLLGNKRTRPTGLLAVCDETAVGAMIAARRMAISIPGELSVVGIDDHQYAEMFGLTTMRQHPREQGRTAVRLLQERMQNPDAPLARRVEASALVVRNSTAPRG
ncbi:LacI family DNA-binding transcriptional regulator [Microbacterium keratanolyticum]